MSDDGWSSEREQPHGPFATALLAFAATLMLGMVIEDLGFDYCADNAVIKGYYRVGSESYNMRYIVPILMAALGAIVLLRVWQAGCSWRSSMLLLISGVVAPYFKLAMEPAEHRLQELEPAESEFGDVVSVSSLPARAAARAARADESPPPPADAAARALDAAGGAADGGAGRGAGRARVRGRRRARREAAALLQRRAARLAEPLADAEVVVVWA